MNEKLAARLLALLVIAIMIMITGGGCANPIAPTGGPKDSLPPALVAVSTGEYATNFTQKRIVFTFDEFVQLDNARSNTIVSPVQRIDFDIQSKLKTVTVRITDTLEPNTTYSINFGNSIKDVNEGNVKKNFTYVFSTGKYVDSLQLTGKVLLAQTGKRDSTLIVMLYRTGDDSAVIKQKPRYYTTLDSTGTYHFRNLPPGVFYLYALEDPSGQRKYIDKSRKFAFADKPVTIGQQNRPDTLFAYVEPGDKLASSPSIPKPIGPKVPAKTDKEKDKRLKFTVSLENGQQDLLSNLEFTFPEPLKNFDSTKVQLTNETFKPITGYVFARDTSNKKLILSYKWPENTAFNFIVDRDFAEDSSGRKIPRTDTLRFRTMKESDYGNFTIRFNNLDFSKHPVMQLLQSDAIKFSHRLTTRDFADKRFKPGEYELQILYDMNDNGVWDAGQFVGKHRQPEHVRAIRKKISIKANWDNDNVIDL